MDKQWYGRDTVIEVDLDALEGNLQQFRDHLPEGTKTLAAVKANAYGHGAIPVARALIRAGISYLGVAFIDEGMELRRAGIDAPILLLGYTPPHAVEAALDYRLDVTIFSQEQLVDIHRQASQMDVVARIHIKVETGMGRLGVPVDQALSLVQKAKELDHVEVIGIFTHLATADDSDKAYLYAQRDLFAELLLDLEEQGIHIPIVHMTNSAGSIELREGAYSMVRLGISLYGYYSSEHVNRQNVQLKPVVSLKSKIVHLKQPPSGMGISYGATYRVQGTEWIATVPVGYADGIDRRLSNRGWALVKGQRVPIVGRVCMDQLMLDVSQVMPVKVGDEVVLYGAQQNERICVAEIAAELDTIPYEITCRLSHRIPRIYLYKGHVEGITNELLDGGYL